MAEKEKKLECAECGDTGLDPEMACRLWVKDRFVDAQGVDEIMEDVIHMHLKDRGRIADELMSRFRENNELDEEMVNDYRRALIDEYERRLLPYL
jgi:hypothetical protein